MSGFIIGKVQPLIVNLKNFEIEKDTLKNQLAQVRHISLTLNAWSSPAHLPYLDVTAHWIISDFKPYKILLSMEELSYPHGATMNGRLNQR
ncbi:zinc finger BED domain-containing protein RICESLEEPER 2 [Rhizophagus clarus]|uniref:Zinc finger BED domain-containing protein RICESLEEPER 2 n=1 Tax=Rhizophagus clarus TaxID=94130 RepID=A0A8H3LKV4_9GLOM|nr:zinc finger BED domain-containing protein RICESLEEPER 2 [Rhizophagus clarus]